MSKEKEALEPSVVLKFIDDLLKRYENKTDYNIYITKDWLLEIKQSLQRLEAIDNANPSEALRELDEIIEYITEDKKVKYKATILFDCEIIKNALLKAQEPKQYLKWEDLEFGNDAKTFNVRLNDNVYELEFYISKVLGKEIVYLNLVDENYITIMDFQKQFFNDLHLERVEE